MTVAPVDFVWEFAYADDEDAQDEHGKQEHQCASGHGVMEAWGDAYIVFARVADRIECAEVFKVGW